MWLLEVHKEYWDTFYLFANEDFFRVFDKIEEDANLMPHSLTEKNFVVDEENKAIWNEFAGKFYVVRRVPVI